MTATRQKEKSAAMRDAVCVATIECLITDGYHGTTTTNIAKRAKVSRGAMQHHYPSRMDTLVGASQYLMQELLAGVERIAEQSPKAKGKADSLVFFLELVWSELFVSRAYMALVELRSACRTDPELAKNVRPLLLSWDESMHIRAHEWLKPHVKLSKKESKFLVENARIYMRGMVVRAAPANISAKERKARDTQVREFIELFVDAVRRRNQN